MATIVTRAGKGAPLTHNEVDANFTNLNTAKYEAGSTIAAASGSASAPSVTFSGDPNTGFYSSAPDVLAITTGGTEAATFEDAGQTVFQLLSSGGDQLLNVDETTDDLLQVINTDNQTLFTVSNTTGVAINKNTAVTGNVTVSGGLTTGTASVTGNLTVDTNTLFVDAANNRVGVGTSSPARNVSIVDSSVPLLQLALSTDQAAGNGFELAYDGVAAYLAQRENLPMVFKTNDTERMRIDSSGNVGLGTSSPNKTGASNSVTVNGSVSSAFEVAVGDAIKGGVIADANGVYFSTRAAIPAVFEINGTERARIDASGNLLVGKTTTATTTQGTHIGNNGEIHLARIPTDKVLRFYNSTTGSEVGYVLVGASSTTYATSSDYRLKENVTSLTGAADRLAQIPVHRFNFIADPNTTVDGFLAHEVQAVIPEAVTGEKDAVDKDGKPVYQGIDQSKLTPLLTAALQEALQKIEALEARITALEAQP